VVSRAQLLELGFSEDWIRHRIAKGRLHPVRRGVYAVGRPGLTPLGRWMAAVLACGDGAALSHTSAGALFGILRDCSDEIEVSVPTGRDPRPQGIRVHKRKFLGGEEVGSHQNIPVTSPIRTLIDLAARLHVPELEAAVNKADNRDLVDPETLRSALEAQAGQRGVRKLRNLLDRHTFRLTESELERRFLPIARRAGLPPPLTQQQVNGYRVDFYWPALGLVVETDGLRYHRTAAQQAVDRRRDQAHTAAGLTPLRFTHYELSYELAHVERTLARVARRLATGASAEAS
jgi:very-short-patch-repair endonuclease